MGTTITKRCVFFLCRSFFHSENSFGLTMILLLFCRRSTDRTIRNHDTKRLFVHWTLFLNVLRYCLVTARALVLWLFCAFDCDELTFNVHTTNINFHQEPREKKHTQQTFTQQLKTGNGRQEVKFSIKQSVTTVTYCTQMPSSTMGWQCKNKTGTEGKWETLAPKNE